MTKNRTEVVTLAMQRLGVSDIAEAVSAEQLSVAGNHLDLLFEEISAFEGVTISWTLATVPDNTALPLAYLLATEVSPVFGVQAPETRGRAMVRLKRSINPDDREDQADTDEDGTTTSDESDAYERAQFY